MIALLFLLLLLPDIYIWHNFLRGCHWGLQVLWFVPVVVSIGLMLLVRTPYYQDWMFRYGLIGILLLTAPKFFFSLFSLCGVWAKVSHPMLWKGTNIAGLIVASMLLVIVGYGLFVGWKRLVVKEVTLEFDDLPEAFDGYRIVQLSDFHIGVYRQAPEMVSEIVDVTNGLKPDMICFTGDLVNSSPEELEPFVDVLSKLKAKDGVYSIMGNHDYCTYRHYDNPRDNILAIEELHRRQRMMGWDLLLNENRIIHKGNDSIMLAGVENSSKPPFPDHGDLKRALAVSAMESAISAPLFTVLLSHDPTHWRREVLDKSKVQLMLAGHTHGTQFKVFGWSPATLVYQEWGGLYERLIDGRFADNADSVTPTSRKLYISTGTGGNLPFRFGVWPEIDVITLKRAQ